MSRNPKKENLIRHKRKLALRAPQRDPFNNFSNFFKNVKKSSKRQLIETTIIDKVKLYVRRAIK
jgi:hypothetical protein